MPRLKCTFQQFHDVIDAHGFVLHNHQGGSHRRYRGVVKGEVRYVDMAPHSWSDDIKRGTLNSMIQQSGLPKKLFRR